eukprot:jgi/Mesen1/3895/ME000208S02896
MGIFRLPRRKKEVVPTVIRVTNVKDPELCNTLNSLDITDHVQLPSQGAAPHRAGALVQSDHLKRTKSGSEAVHTVSILQKQYVNVLDYYDLGPIIGEGEFGCVRSCISRRTGERLACKVISKSRLRTPAAVAAVQTEVAVMEAVGEHPSIVTLRDTVEDSQHVCLIMELCNGGDLFTRISERRHYSEANAAEVCARIAEVVRHCRSKSVLHRDLKPENILLCHKESDTIVRLADFGASTFVKLGKKLTMLAGSPYYVAPEVIDGCYGIEADVWSLGVILYILLCGVPPFWHEEEEGILSAIKQGKVDMAWGPWKNISEDAKDLVMRMLTRDTWQRITPEEILAHPWITKWVMPVPRSIISPRPIKKKSLLRGFSVPCPPMVIWGNKTKPTVIVRTRTYTSEVLLRAHKYHVVSTHWFK